MKGGLELSVNLPGTDDDLFKITDTTDSNWLQPDSFMEEIVKEAHEYTRRLPIREQAKLLQGKLRGTAKFFLPGAGNFFYENPIYNKEHDLMVEATYNG